MASHKAYRHLGLKPRSDPGLGIGDSKALFEADDPGDRGSGPPNPESRIQNPGPRSVGRHGMLGKISTPVAWSTQRSTWRSSNRHGPTAPARLVPGRRRLGFNPARG